MVLSPGPQLPKDAHQLFSLIEHFEKSHPMLGICLGHQALNEFYGGTLKILSQPKHGKVSEVSHAQAAVFENLSSPLSVVRYHSWEVNKLAPSLSPLAYALDDNSIMAFSHLTKPITGIQFHPESILTTFGMDILKNWLIVNSIS